MAIRTTPLGFKKPDGREPVRGIDNVISDNADAAEREIQKALALVRTAVTGPPGKDGSNVLPTAAAVAQAITTPGSPANTALSATIAAMIQPAVLEDTSNPGLYDIANSGAITEDPSTPGLYSIGA